MSGYHASIIRLPLILLLTFTASCSGDNDIPFERSVFTVHGQSFEILTATQLFQAYANGLASYKSQIFQRIKTEFSENAEYDFIFRSIESEIPKSSALREEIDLLADADLSGIARAAFSRIVPELPGPATSILFIPANPVHRPLLRKLNIGVTAITVGSGKIIISIDPVFNGWEQQLQAVLAHEYHHSVWTARNFTTVDFTPLEYLVFEGRADSFAKYVWPNVSSPWTDRLSTAQERRVWNIIKPHLHEPGSEWNDLVMNGTDEIPHASGYTIGYHIVEAYRENHPEITQFEMIDLDPLKILHESGYPR